MMQTEIELALAANISSAIISGLVAVFLLRLWFKQENRIYSDLPLLFSVTFISMAANTALQSLILGGIIPDIIEVFRFRSLIISGTALPLLAALLNIWLPRFERHHLKIMILSIAYWAGVSFYGPTDVLIMAMLIPLLLAFSLMMLVTFAITWKTGRLKEVRSDLMVASMLIGFISQVLKIPLQAAGFDWLIASVTAMTAVIAAVALANPWYHRSMVKSKRTPEVTYPLPI